MAYLDEKDSEILVEKVKEYADLKESLSNKTDVLNAQSTQEQYPNAQIVYNTIPKAISDYQIEDTMNRILYTTYPIIVDVTKGLYIGNTVSGIEFNSRVIIIPNEGCDLPASVNVTNALYSYNNITGEIIISNPIGNVTITAQCIETHPLVINVQYGTYTGGGSTIKDNQTITFTVIPSTGGSIEYQLPNSISVINASYTWDDITGVGTISNPTGDVTVQVNCIISSGAIDDIIEDYYNSYFGITNMDIPEFPMSGITDIQSEIGNGLNLRLYGLTDSEIIEAVSEYGDLFVQDGWDVSTDLYGDQTCERVYGNVKATIKIMDYSGQYGGYLRITAKGEETLDVSDINDIIQSYFSTQGITTSIPECPWIADSVIQSSTTQLKVYLSDMQTVDQDMSDYADLFEQDNWGIEYDGTYGDYTINKAFGNMSATIQLSNYSSYISITFSAAINYLVSDVNDLIQSYFSTQGITTSIPECPWIDATSINKPYTNRITVYGYSSQTGDQAIEDYADLFEQDGWTRGTNPAYNAPLLTKIFGASQASITLAPNAGTIVILLAVQAAPEPEPEGSPTFPFTEVNAFLQEYDLGFTVDSNLQFPGDNFVSITGESGGYHCYLVKIYSGDNVNTIESILLPTLTAAGYTQASQSSGIAYINEDYHEIDIRYDSNNNFTLLYFWE